MRGSAKARARTRKPAGKLVPAVLAVLVACIISVAAVIALRASGGHGGTASGSPRGAAGSVTRDGTAATASPGGTAGPGGTAISASQRAKMAGVAQSLRAVPPQAPQTRGATWVNGAAGKLLSTVNTDLGTISADERAGNYSAARSAGAQLAAAAAAALKGPMPPLEAALYRAALKDFELIGTDTASGDYRDASSLLAPANLAVMEVTAAADPPAPVNPVAG